MKNAVTKIETNNGSNSSIRVKNPNACLLSYAVYVHIVKSDSSDKHETILYDELFFKDERAINARKKAFEYAYLSVQKAAKGHKLYENRVDTSTFFYFNQGDSTITISVSIFCINEDTGDNLPICEGDFHNGTREYFHYCVRELEWYHSYGYDTGGCVVSVQDMSSYDVQILDVRMNPRCIKKVELVNILKLNQATESTTAVWTITPIETAFQRFLDEKSEILSTQTIQFYKVTLSHLQGFCDSENWDFDWVSFEPTIIEGFDSYLREQQLTEQVIAKYKKTLRSFLYWCLENENYNPYIVNYAMNKAS